MTTTTPTVRTKRNLDAAKAAKNDEFYTQWADIEREMNAYLEYDPDVFRDKVILLPCDDPEWSNFTKFFALHFVDFGLKKLISTSYAPDSNPAKVNYQPTLFESESPAFDATKTRVNGKKFTLEPKDINDDGVINIDDLQWEYLEGDGDFRSPEVTALRDEADIVITNPPFSLFREFLAWLVAADKKFSMIGNSNAITYNESSRSSRTTSCGRARRRTAPTWSSASPRASKIEPRQIASRPRSLATRQTMNVTTRASGTPAGSPTSTTVDATSRSS